MYAVQYFNSVPQLNESGYVVRYGIVNRWQQKKTEENSILEHQYCAGTIRRAFLDRSHARTSFLMNMDGWEWSFLEFFFATIC